MPRRFIRKENWEFGGTPPDSEETGEPTSRKRRLATTLAFTTLFFAGASLAAVAGDQLSPYVASDQSAEEATTDTTTTTEAEAAPAPDAASEAAAPAADATAEAAPADSAAPDATATPDAQTPEADSTATEPELTSDQAANDGFSATLDSGTTQHRADAKLSPAAKKARQARLRKTKLEWMLLPKVKKAPAPEIEGPANAATIWLNSPLPDPTPPALRLSAKFAANLKGAARGAGVNWAVMLGVLRARGASGHSPADRATLRKLAARLGSHGPTRGDWATIVAYAGDNHFADKAAALARYDRAVGLDALVNGLESAKKSIGARLLSDRMVSIYAGGQSDIVANKVDVRVLAMIAYLRESFGQVTISSLISGHRLYARPGVISAHIAGHALDVSGLGGTPIMGHQEPGGITERAVREILFAPAEIMPRQVISLLGLGGPSFPMGDHYNHIHIGY
jgi:hypothetical protein